MESAVRLFSVLITERSVMFKRGCKNAEVGRKTTAGPT
jgi:hypothetical protein